MRLRSRRRWAGGSGRRDAAGEGRPGLCDLGQEGRGYGLLKKSKAYRLQDAGAIANAEEIAQMQTGPENSPIVTGDAAMQYQWSNQVVAIFNAAGEGRQLPFCALSRGRGGTPRHLPQPRLIFSSPPRFDNPPKNPAGQPADALHREQIPPAAVLAEAQDAPNAERWDDALKLRSTAAARDDGQQLRTFNGLYMANMKLGRTAEAEEAFGKIAALGLATSNLAVKILYLPGKTDFMGDPATYAMWVRQIARAVPATDLCLNLVGPPRKTGTAQGNRPPVP